MKRALVTGGTRGIGLEIVKLFFERGYSVTAAYSEHEEDAARARALLPSVRFLQADVSREEEAAALIGSLPSLDVLVCNAGISHFGQVQDISFGDYRRVTDVNFGGVLFCCKYAVKKMLSKGGSVVNVTSVWGDTGGSCESLYSATKGAVAAFSKALAKELAPSKITVNCVSPGVVDTRMNARLSEEECEALQAEIPLGRFARPEEIARAVLFLAEHPYITGQTLAVNGGFYI